MKKSKFLKKSLAMLLALMLVVAMIPLSASADTPLLRRVDVHAGGQVVQTTAGEAANTYVGEIPNLSEEITLEVLTGRDNQVFYTRETSTATEDVPATLFDGEVQWTFNIPAGDVSNYENENGDIEIHFTVADKDRPGTRLQYTVLLTPVYVSTDLGIEKFTLNSMVGENVQLGETVIGASDIYFTVPYDNWWFSQVTGFEGFRIRELELTSATATVTFSRVADGGTDYYYTTEAATDKVVTAGNPVILIQDGDQMTIENNGASKTYDLHIDTAPGFTSFTMAEALDSEMFVNDGTIAVLLPYGYGDDYTGTVDVTPVFDLDFEKAWVTVDGVVIDGVDDTITIDETLINYGAPGSTNSCFGTYLGETDTDWTGRDRSGWENFKTGGIGDDECIEFTVHYSEEASRTYDVYFMEPNENSEALITEFSIGSEDAVIDQEAGTIDITVPMGTDISELNAALGGATISHTDVDLVASNNATITVPLQDVRNNTTVTEPNDAANDRQRFVDFDMTGTLDATMAVDIRVVSEDTLTENWYELNVTVADEFVEPAITDISIQSPDGSITIEGTPTVDPETGRSIILFEELPYEVYDRTQLNDWRLFYTKTIGSTITYDSNGTAVGGTAIALPKSGSVIGSYNDAPYIPDPDDKDIEGNVAIDLRVDGDELSAIAKSYTIMLSRGEGNTVSSLKDFDLYGVPDFAAYGGTWAGDTAGSDYHNTANLTSRYIYEGIVDTQEGPGSTITVNVPWSVYQQWDTDNSATPNTDDAFGALVEAAEESNARVYVVVEDSNGDENLHPIYDYTETDPTPVYKIEGGADRSIYDLDTIVVLSERTWVSLLEDDANGVGNYIPNGTWADCIDNWDDIKASANANNDYGFYTEYTLNIEQADATKGNTFEDEPRLVDGTGWTAALEVDARSGVGRIEGEIPYALTSDFNDPKTWNPVYLEYGVDDWAFVLGDDRIITNGNVANSVSRDGNGIPTAGTARDGVFIDIADYLEMYVNEDGSQNYDLALAHYYSDGNPFFLIGRDGTVRVYNYTGPLGEFVPFVVPANTTRNAALADDTIVVSSENGAQVTHYTFDLEVLPANTEAQINQFWFEEYPNRMGDIDEATKTITVTLPFGTEYTYLTPNYEVSSGAIVTIDDPELLGKPLFPGYTDVNFSTSRKVTVIPENEDGNTEYTVRVQIEEQFSDVSEGDWFYDNVMDAAANGYVNGYTDGTFGPTKDITRAEFAAMVANAFGYETNNDVDPAFKDVEQGHWANGAIAFCAERGYINGYTDGTFQPNKTISRQEAASILKNTFNLTGNTGDLFPDDSAIASWAKDNVYAVKHSGLMKGDAGTGNFRPTATITRAEAASIFMNANAAGLID